MRGKFLVALTTLAISGGGNAFSHDLDNAPAKPSGALPPEILQTIDLGKEIPGMENRTLRMRKVVLEPGGAIPAHGHADRPAIVYILQGRVREHRSDLAEPLEYGAGQSITENAAVHHWIENIGSEQLIGIVVDLVNDGSPETMSAEQILKLYGLTPHNHD